VSEPVSTLFPRQLRETAVGTGRLEISWPAFSSELPGFRFLCLTAGGFESRIHGDMATSRELGRSSALSIVVERALAPKVRFQEPAIGVAFGVDLFFLFPRILVHALA
jgi:hypothetical protein